ncbi:signal transduction histidine-protein kinase/phosphatase UhpB [Vibrio sp. E150_011]
MRTYLVASISAWLITLCSWFCLWVISYYFVNDAEMAILFLPFALRLGVTLHCAKKYWPAIYTSEWALTISLAVLLAQPQWSAVLVASIASIPVAWVSRRYNTGPQWQRLSVQAMAIVGTAIINMLALSGHATSLSLVGLVTVTGGLMLVPTCYLVWNYLFQSIWRPLTSNLIHQPITFQIKPIVLITLLFISSISLQIGLPDELRRFAPFCLAIPIILLAFRYGWQGALLGTLLNSSVLIAARSGVSQIEVTDLLLSISAQSLTGILLGVAVQRQRDLNQKLRQELSRNQNLSKQLVQAEESVRKDIARELHDEIGQNITAIRTQASIIKRVNSAELSVSCANTIESLSLNVYDTTKGLLTRLRPKTLDDLDVVSAIKQMVREMEFEQLGVHVEFEVDDNAMTELSDTMAVTLFRLCQEALNNAQKYAKATQVHIALSIDTTLRLVITDDGVGFRLEESQKGFGLKGMQERVQALGGQLTIRSSMDVHDTQRGTVIDAKLPLV